MAFSGAVMNKINAKDIKEQLMRLDFDESDIESAIQESSAKGQKLDINTIIGIMNQKQKQIDCHIDYQKFNEQELDNIVEELDDQKLNNQEVDKDLESVSLCMDLDNIVDSVTVDCVVSPDSIGKMKQQMTSTEFEAWKMLSKVRSKQQQLHYEREKRKKQQQQQHAQLYKKQQQQYVQLQQQRIQQQQQLVQQLQQQLWVTVTYIWDPAINMWVLNSHDWQQQQANLQALQLQQTKLQILQQQHQQFMQHQSRQPEAFDDE